MAPLWLETRIEAGKSSSEELNEFGWLFVSGKLGDDWSIGQLQKVLELTGQTAVHMIAQRLAGLAAANPLQCVRTLSMIVDGDSTNLQVLGWGEHAKEIIRAGRRSNDPNASKAAAEITNVLGSRGHFAYLELLQEPID